MSEWISWLKLHEPPYSKEDFELLAFIPNGSYPFDSLNKEPVPCPDFCHFYHQQWKRVDEDKLTEEEHEDIKRTFAEITDHDPEDLFFLSFNIQVQFVVPCSAFRIRVPSHRCGTEYEYRVPSRCSGALRTSQAWPSASRILSWPVSA